MCDYRTHRSTLEIPKTIWKDGRKTDARGERVPLDRRYICC
jgi:hypothetical protein